jgi:ABC-type transport system involved in cytochrome bd biosynthesis fused ATPase/permease subunit
MAYVILALVVKCLIFGLIGVVALILLAFLIIFLIFLIALLVNAKELEDEERQKVVRYHQAFY